MKMPRQTPPSSADRKDRLKSALQANIARRKAQARARAETGETGDTETPAAPDVAQEKE